MKTMKRPRKLKTKLHFNRVNMRRGDKRVWSAHNSRSCNMAERIIIRHKGETVAETVYKPEATQPRAYFVVYGNVHFEDGVAVVEV